jgi:hypothetical protein
VCNRMGDYQGARTDHDESLALSAQADVE